MPLDRLVIRARCRRLGAWASAPECRGDAASAWPGCRGRGVDGREFACDVDRRPLSGRGAPGRWVMQVQETGCPGVRGHPAAGIGQDGRGRHPRRGHRQRLQQRARRHQRQHRGGPPSHRLAGPGARRGNCWTPKRPRAAPRVWCAGCSTSPAPRPGVRRPHRSGPPAGGGARVLRRDLDPRVTLVTRDRSWRLAHPGRPRAADRSAGQSGLQRHRGHARRAGS